MAKVEATVEELVGIIRTSGQTHFEAQCIPTGEALLEVGNYKAFLDNRRTLIAKRLNEFLGE